MRDADGRVWVRRDGHAILLHPYERVGFYAFRITASDVVLDVGDDEPERYPHERLHKLELEPTPYRPGMPLSRSEKSGVGRPAND
jgi:hypothetical protein